MPYKDPEKQRAYMRNHQKRHYTGRKQDPALLERTEELMHLFQVHSAQRREELKDLLTFFQDVFVAVNTRGLSDGEVVQRIRSLPLSERLYRHIPWQRVFAAQPAEAV
jgi:hypothetical protein